MKRLLIVVDFQKDFVEGFLGEEGARQLDDRIASKIESYRENGDKIIFVLDTRHSDYLHMQNCSSRPVPHAFDGLGQNGLYGRVSDLREDIDEVFFKASFGSPDLFQRLTKAQKVGLSMGVPPYQSIELAGLSATRCLLSNVVIARTACPEVPVMVDMACTAARSDEALQRAKDIFEELGVRLLNA